MPPISFSGLASGIDGDAVIKAILDARRNAQKPLENRITQLDAEDKALNEFKTKVLTLNDKVKAFLTVSGNAVARSVTVSDKDTIEAVAGSNAVISNTSLTVNRLASSATASFSNSFSEPSDLVAPGISGDEQLTIKIGSGANQKIKTITISPTTTLTQAVDAINAEGSGLFRATVVNLSGGSPADYRLAISGMATGELDGLIEIEQSSGLASAGALTVGTVQQAVDAEVLVQGLGTVRRPTNQISDLIPGVTVNLKRVSPVAVTLGVNNDTSKTATAVNEMITAINEVIKYSKQNSTIQRQETSSTVKNIYGTLARESSDESLISEIRNAASRSNSSEISSAVRILSDLGITTERDGTYKFEVDDFNSAMSKDPVAVGEILRKFGDSLGSTTGILYNYTKYQGSFDQVRQANEEERKSLNARILRSEESLAKQQEMLKRQFSALESTVAQLNSSGTALQLLFTKNNQS